MSTVAERTDKSGDVIMTQDSSYKGIYDCLPGIIAKIERDGQTQLPIRPTPSDLEPYIGKMYAFDKSLIAHVQRHLDKWGAAPNHSFEEHILKIAATGAFAADIECSQRGVTGERRDEIIQRAWRFGLLHDLQRVRGLRAEDRHEEESALAARYVLSDLEIHDPYLEKMVLVHDQMYVEPSGIAEIDIPFYSVFAADHLEWGLNMEGPYWQECEKKHRIRSKDDLMGIVNFAYGALVGLSTSPNLRQTLFGSKVTFTNTNYGLNIVSGVRAAFVDREVSLTS